MCNNGCFGGSCSWILIIILLLIFCGSNSFGNTFSNNGCGCNNNCGC